MAAKRTKYIVEVSGYHAGRHILEVVSSFGDEAGRYVTGSPFGCSKTYKVRSDYEAIVKLLAEHACLINGSLQVGDVIKVPGYGFPMYISELDGIQAVLHPAWQDEKKQWHPMTAGFRLHTPLDTNYESINE